MLLREEKGSAIFVVLIAFMVLTVLGSVIVFAANTEGRQSVRQSDKKQAYYYARSGAEAASEWLINGGSVDEKAYVYGDFLDLEVDSDNNGSGEDIDVSIEENADKVIITSTGRYNEAEEKVILEFERAAGDGGPFIGLCTDNKVWSYSDGEWTQLSNQPEHDQNKDFNAMAWSGNELVVLGRNHAVSILEDLNGEWENDNLRGGGPSNHFEEVIWSDERESFLAISFIGHLFEREEGKGVDDWNQLTGGGDRLFNNKDNVNAVYGDGKLVAVTGDEAINYYDFDSDETGEFEETGYDNAYFDDVAYGNGVFVAVGTNNPNWTEEGVIYSSDNGKDWSEEVRTEDIERFGTITWSGDHFVTAKGEGLGYAYSIKKSTDGKEWTDTGEWESGWDLNWNNIIKVNDTIMATSSESSPDGGDHGAYVISYNGGESWDFVEHEDVPKIKRFISTDEEIDGSEFQSPTWR